MKTCRILITITALLVCMCTRAEIITGNCGAEGDNIKYTIDTENGELRLDGKGDMMDYWKLGLAFPWRDNRLSIKKLIINDGITSITTNAFIDLANLEDVNISSSVTSFANNAFTDCRKIKEPVIVNGMLVYFPLEYSGEYYIPENVTKIIDDAFRSCKKITSINVPNSVTSIGKGAFALCTKLISIKLPDSIEKIDEYTFSACYSLEHVEIPNCVKIIDRGAFQECLALKEMIIPNSVTSIGVYAFRDCSSIETMKVPYSVTSIADNTLAGNNTAIKHLYWDCNIPDVSIFTEELYIGDNVEIVDGQKFYYVGAGGVLNRLRKVVLGKNVKEIKPKSFYKAEVEEFYITGSLVPKFTEDIFGHNENLSKYKLYIPEGTEDYYTKTYPWSEFGQFFTLDGKETSIDKRNKEYASITSIISPNGAVLPEMKKGFNIIKYSNGTIKKMMEK